jgi:hypothetical protein
MHVTPPHLFSNMMTYTTSSLYESAFLGFNAFKTVDDLYMPKTPEISAHFVGTDHCALLLVLRVNPFQHALRPVTGHAVIKSYHFL